jgi:hypothetical protein
MDVRTDPVPAWVDAPRRRGNSLSLTAWLAVPWLYAGAVLGVTAMFGFLLGVGWDALVSTALFGPAAAVAALTGVGNDSWPRGVRPVLRVLYPIAVFTAGTAIGPVTVAKPIAATVGLPALAVLVLVCRQDRDRQRISRR